MITFRCDAGGNYGMGHAMRLRAVAQAVHAMAPTMPMQIVGTTPALTDIFAACHPWAPVALYGDDVARMYASKDSGPVVVDMPRGWSGDTVRCCHGPIIRLDAPWATPESCDVIILPGLHHSADTLADLYQRFQQRLFTGAQYAVLPNPVLPLVPFGQRVPAFSFVAGGSDPQSLLPHMFTLTRPLLDLLRATPRIYYLGDLAASWTAPIAFGDVLMRFESALFNNVGLCVCAWGITAYECLAAQTPAVIIAHDQATAADAARAERATQGALQSWGELTDYSPETFSTHLAALWHDTSQRQSMHNAGKGLIDDLGAKRIAQVIFDHYSA